MVLLGRHEATQEGTGKGFTAPFAHVWKVEGGVATAFQQYADTVVHRRPME